MTTAVAVSILKNMLVNIHHCTAIILIVLLLFSHLALPRKLDCRIHPRCKELSSGDGCECGSFMFLNIPQEDVEDSFELLVKRTEEFSNLSELRNLKINVGESYRSVLLKCNFNGSFADILLALNVTRLEMLTVDTFLTSVSLTHFDALPFRISTFVLQNRIDRLLPDPGGLPRTGFEQVETLVISNSNIKKVPNGYFSNLTNLSKLTIKANGYLEFIGKESFAKLSYLNTLELIGNRNLRYPPASLLQSLTSLQKLVLDESKFETIPQDLLSHNKNLQYLSLRHDNCWNVNPKSICERIFSKDFFVNLTKLEFFSYSSSGGHLNASFEENAFDGNLRLETLILRGVWLLPNDDLRCIQDLSRLQNFHSESNNLRRILSSHIPASLRQISINGSNDFHCDDCETVRTLGRLKALGKLITDVSFAHCKKSLITLEKAQNSCVSTNAFFIFGPIVFLVIVCFAVVMFLQVRKAYEEKKRLDEEYESFEKDAFISFVDNDCSFVNQMVDTLEEKNNFTCLVHTRDFNPGETILQNIEMAVSRSRTVVIVLSKGFLSSSFCTHELNEAVLQNKRILVVMRSGDQRPSKESLQNQPNVQSYIKKYTYLEENDKDFEVKLLQFVEGKTSKLRYLFLKSKSRNDHVEMKQNEEINA